MKNTEKTFKIWLCLPTGETNRRGHFKNFSEKPLHERKGGLLRLHQNIRRAGYEIVASQRVSLNLSRDSCLELRTASEVGQET
jgi:hypothetical protein